MDIFLRAASMDDAQQILAWRNDPVTRENSFSKNEIDLETHLKWFQGKLESEDCFLYIMMDGAECVGQLRIDRVGDVGEISYMIAPDKRGNGYGSRIIALAEYAVRKDSSMKALENDVVPQNCNMKILADGAVLQDGSLKALTGLVEKENLASRKCFLKNGYSEFVGGGIYCYIKVLS